MVELPLGERSAFLCDRGRRRVNGSGGRRSGVPRRQ